MARARNLKPGFFKNETLAECSPLARLLFSGLWCLADRAGRLEDRPKRIRAEVLPYDDGSVDDMLDELHRAGFILRYQVGDERFIQVLNFTKHQNPHCREPESTIPAPVEHSACTVPKQDEHRTGPADSLNLIPLTLSPDVPASLRASDVSKDEPKGFAECWEAYPKREGGNSKTEAMKAYRARLKTGVDPAALLAGVQRYAAYVRTTGKEGTSYVKQAASFFGPGEHWKEAWNASLPVCHPGPQATATGNVFAGAV
jgi:hypothetical protein